MSTFIHRSLSGGEIAPELHARVDLGKYATALRLGRNVITPRTGGVQNRPGTQFVGEAGNSTTAIRLIPFVISPTESYVIEFGSGYWRVLFNGRPLTFGDVGSSNLTLVSMTNANPGVFTCTSHGMSNGAHVTATISQVPDLDGGTFVVANVTTNTFTFTYLDGTAVDTSAMAAYTSGGTINPILTQISPYAVADLPLIKFTQNFTSLTLTAKGYAIREITLNVLNVPKFSMVISNLAAPDVAPPTNIAGDQTAGTTTFYTVTAIGVDGEESLFGTAYGMSHNRTGFSDVFPATITWTDNPNAYAYNVYARGSSGMPGILIWCLLNVGGPIPQGTQKFVDLSTIAFVAKTRPVPIIDGATDGNPNTPTTSTYYQQRRYFGATSNNPETVYASWIGHYNDFFLTNQTNDSQALLFSLSGIRVNEIQHFVGLTRLFILSKTTEFVCGGTNGPITPHDINVTPYSYYGSYYIQPVVIGDRFLFVQARGSIIRDFGFEYTDGNYKGNDLTILATHLFNGFTVADWCYQQTPNSILWVVRNDGTLLSLTYIREQQILAWTRHDFTGGVVENVCSIPETNGDSVYVTVRRTINGRTTRYLERILADYTTDVREFSVMDSHLAYDGRNTTVNTMTLSGGSSWLYTETLTLTCSASFFKSTDIGNEIQLNDVNGNQIRFRITGYTSATIVTGHPNKTVPASLQGVAITLWTKAVQQLLGLRHLQGQMVSVLGDGFVVSSPNNPSIATITVSTDGKITLDRPYGVIQVGLPFVSDIETLDIDLPQGETLSDKVKIISKITAFVNRTRGFWAGNNPNDPTSLTGLDEFKARNAEGYDAPIELATDQIEINIQPAANKNGRVFIRQVDPVPMTVCAIAPAGLIPTRG